MSAMVVIFSENCLFGGCDVTANTVRTHTTTMALIRLIVPLLENNDDLCE
jgi:hypothetical protein